MTPIDDELRTTLHRRAGTVAPPADPLAGIVHRATRIRRRRVTVAVAGSALAVAAITVGVPVGRHALINIGGGDLGGYAGGQASPRSGPPVPMHTAGADPNGLANFVAWPSRGSVEPAETLDHEISRLWAKAHNIGADEAGIAMLWHGTLPGGGRAGVWQFWKLGTKIGYTVIGQRLPNGHTFILRDEVTPKAAVRQISAVLQGGAFPHVLVLGPPGTVQIRYAADGVRLVPVERLPGFAGGDGWAVFDRTGPALDQKRSDLIDIVHADGFGIYHGPIDTGPSGPDV